MARITVDHPKVRDSRKCPLCGDKKETGLVSCWPCYRRYGLRQGNPQAENRIDYAEHELTHCIIV